MKVRIGPYRNWFGPYQLAEFILFWMDKYEDKRVHKFGDWLAHGSTKRTDESLFRDDRPNTWLYTFLLWVDKVKPKRKVKVHIDRWDTWSMDGTLSMIILPMLKQLHSSKQGAPYTDDEDVPEDLRSTSAPAKENEWDTDANHFKRWDWVMDELVWTFEQLHPDNDWEKQYQSGKIEFMSIPSKETSADGEPLTYQLVKHPSDTYECDYDGIEAHNKRIKNGLRLFGKYYQNLWD